ncbi:LolA family protein [Oceanobacillus chungangensis]|uniref:DUF4367 domain-containing protein n=1 Tax=Oceanobacillus chungangensis TaxID=1229152 RepID=A0A3D8PIN8_9BACI|nr:outer membrane lipoprotein carrier protein LolA [Oceanobacillus chungangensis]RDW15088.1 DUF4367 domain-containing protein [Oceanobacillus chungangensis]
MRKVFNWKLLIFGLLILVLAACGEKSQEDVVKKLSENLEKLSSYKAQAEMTMNTGQEEQKFNIDIWHKKDGYYRVSLSSNLDDKGSQIILKNKDGVFVLTPALNKSFKFQSEWPQNSSQPYLYQSLINDVLKDGEAAFEANDSHYVFRTKTNYQSNNNLPNQEIYFDKKTLTPATVKVLDKDNNVLVEVNFASFELDSKFAEDDFSVDKNLAASAASAAPSGEEAVSESKQVLSVMLPEYTAGAELAEQKNVELENGNRVILTFTGERSFTLVEEHAEVLPTLSEPKEVKGEIVNLGHTVAALTDKTLEWSYDGVDYILASDELTKDEMIQVAESVQGKSTK